MRYLIRTIFVFILLSGGVGYVEAAPDIISQNLTGSGSFTPGQTITFTANTTNAGTVMDLSNSFNFVSIADNNGDYERIIDSRLVGNYLYAVGNSLNSTYCAPEYSYSCGDFVIYDVSNPKNPQKIGSVKFRYTPTSMAVKGNYVYAYTGLSTGAYIIDISNKTNPNIVGNWSFSGLSGVRTMQVQGNYLYAGGDDISTSRSNFYVFNVTNPTSPQLVHNKRITNDIVSLTVAGNYLYVTDARSVVLGVAESHLRVFSLANPASPQAVSVLNFPSELSDNNSHSITYNNGYLYVTHGQIPSGSSKAVYAIDVNNPSSPQFVSDFINGSWYAHFSSIYYPYLHVGVGNTGGGVVETFKINDPASLVRKSVSPDIYTGNYTNIRSKNPYLITTRGAKYPEPSLYILEPHVFSRFCIDNANCANSTTGRLGSTDFDAGRLEAGATHESSATWVATLGQHTIYFCTDVKDNRGFYGVDESNENNNCGSYTFTVAEPATGSINATDCIISAGSNSCDSVVSWNTDSLAPSVKQDGVQFSITQSSPGTARSVNYGSHLFAIYDSTTELDSASTSASCVGGTSWNGSVCQSLAQPNLAAESFSYSGGQQAGQTLSLSGVVRNNGTANTGNGFDDIFEYRIGGSGAFSPIKIETNSALASGATNSDTASFVIPSAAAGQVLYLQYCIDHGGQVTESDETVSDNCEQTSFSVSAVENGQCGSRNGVYPWDATSWQSGSDYCQIGTPSATPAFPTQSIPAQWLCEGSGGGATAACQATVSVPVPPELSIDSDKVLVRKGGEVTLIWEVTATEEDLTCVVNGSGGVSDSFTVSSNSSYDNSPGFTTTVNGKSTYLLTCQGTYGTYTVDAVVETTGTFEEV